MSSRFQLKAKALLGTKIKLSVNIHAEINMLLFNITGTNSKAVLNTWAIHYQGWHQTTKTQRYDTPFIEVSNGKDRGQDSYQMISQRLHKVQKHLLLLC